jgi:hypothetical protein
MDQFVIGIILAIFASWFGVSAYDSYVTIAEFSEMQQTLFNAKIAFAGLLTLIAIILQFKKVVFLK